MFTGIITNIGIVKSLSRLENQDLMIVLNIDCQNSSRTFDIGSSIACNGVCLTLIKRESADFSFQASQETISKTNIKDWKIGDKINIEFALRMGDELGGHMVSGHIDCTVMVKKITAINNDSWCFSIELPQAFKSLITKKGSIVLNGVSLTINEVFDDSFSVNVIKHTFDNTNFSQLREGDFVNLEVDMIARYLERLLANKA